MKIRYEFATETVEIEVEEQWATVIADLDRQDYNVNHKETRRHCSLDAFNLDDSLFPSDSNVEGVLLDAEDKKRLYNAIKVLSQEQQSIIKSIYFNGVSISTYAKKNGVSQPAVTQRLQTIKKKMKKLLK